MKIFYKLLGEGGTPLLILHGLLGSSDNWFSISKILSEKRQVILADARNHGRSPHSDAMNYEEMAADVVSLLDDLNIPKVHILGHSMGGKTAMFVALHYTNRVEQLIVADIAPKVYSGGHEAIFQAMISTPLDSLGSRQEIEDYLSDAIPATAVRLFIMKNLSRSSSGGFYWKPNLQALWNHYQTLLGFPYIPSGNTFPGSALFIKGQLSNYISPADEIEIIRLFPEAKFITIDHAGHWLHAEQPGKFTDAVQQFLK